MSRVVTNPAPKSRFQESGGNISEHRDLLQGKSFERAIDWALLQYQYELCREKGDLNSSAAKHLRMQGAQEFIDVLKYLAESPTREMASKITNLDHNA